LVALAGSVGGLAAVGNYLLAQDPSGAWATHYVLDKAGNIQDSKEWNYYSRHYDWAPGQSRVYFFRDDSSPNDLMFEVIDQASGKISSAGESPYHGEYATTGPIRVSPGGGRIILGAGNIYSTSDLKVVGNIGVTFLDAQWLADGSLVIMRASGNGANLRKYDANLAFVREQPYNGTPLALVRLDSGVVLVSQYGDRPIFGRF
jgi:hypothetical protein